MNRELLFKIINSYPKLKYALLEEQTFDPKHFGFSDFYYKLMETDKVRINAFRKAFEYYNNLENKVVCEVGVGTLALTKFYLPFVKRAYLIESNPNLFEFIESEIKKNNWGDKVHFIKGDALKTELPEQVDFIIGENMSIYCANELQVQLFQHLRKYLKPTGKLIPEKIINLIQLGCTTFDSSYRHFPIMFTHHLPTLITKQKKVNTIDLYKAEDEPVKKTIKLKSLLEGKINCALLNSWVQCAPGANFTGTDSLMPPTVIQLENDINARSGDRINLNINYSFGHSLDEAVLVAKIKN